MSIDFSEKDRFNTEELGEAIYQPSVGIPIVLDPIEDKDNEEEDNSHKYENNHSDDEEDLEEAKDKVGDGV
jgi:hypothetical protein